MAYKRILLPIDSKGDITQIADFAFALASQHKAQVQGVCLLKNEWKNYWLDTFGLQENQIEEIENKAKQNRDDAVKNSRKIFKLHSTRYPDVEAKHISVIEKDSLSFVDHSFCSDITLLGNTAKYSDEYWQNLANQMLAQSTRPLLILPPRPVPKGLGNRVVIAWKRTQEASRAIAAAMPLIEKAKRVLIVSVDGKEDYESQELLKDYLSLHVVSVESIMIKSKGEDAGRLLIDKAAEVEGSILVMGAYSHRRWREQLFGGVTKYILNNTDVPVLMMH